MSHFSTENETKLLEVENYLANNQYISGGGKPDQNDGRLIASLNKKIPDQKKYPNLFAWYAWLNNFSPQFLEQLQQQQNEKLLEKSSTKLSKKTEDHIKLDLDKRSSDPDRPQHDKKHKEEEAKFYCYEEDSPDSFQKYKQQEKIKEFEQKNNKAPKSPQTILILDVKILEIELEQIDQNLESLAHKIFQNVQMDGLTWTKDYTLEPSVYDIKKLRVLCIVDEEKIPSIEYIIDILQSWDEIQSVEIFQQSKS